MESLCFQGFSDFMKGLIPEKVVLLLGYRRDERSGILAGNVCRMKAEIVLTDYMEIIIIIHL